MNLIKPTLYLNEENVDLSYEGITLIGYDSVDDSLVYRVDYDSPYYENAVEFFDNTKEYEN